jgi:serine/threonine protein kinase/tetratricopeptide (TPR) repeat protein
MTLMSRLLDEALPLNEAARGAWLERATQEHPDLAAALREALLPGAARAADLKALMSLPKLNAADKASGPAASGLKPGARVGPYELIRLSGAGGMAEVWLARRADGAFKREVALKLPMLARAQAGLEARFARERDILASLEHPHIARLYDAGVGREGLPFIAMEYVQGAPLTEWCDAHRLGIPKRLGLFLQVLEAAQYAHEKHIIHRDLKPSNILVTESGQVRLLDFGVARLLEGEETDQPVLTSVYGRALTPDYASPELLSGATVDARSDIYSLGVLLYELLTSVRPYRLKSAASIGALDQAIATLEVKRPSVQLEQASAASRASTGERLARQVRGDLDAVVLKALTKDPAQRYPSAEAMAEDLRAYQAGKPIQAQPARLSYRLRKFVRRNRMPLGVSAVALVAILAAVGYVRYRESLTQVTVSAKSLAVPAAPNPASAVTAFTPPAHSIAVLPFVNMSGDKEQEYFSDGLSEELLNDLARINGLQVAARTSAFSFKGKDTDIGTIARKLNVGTVLEGSVRRSKNTVRITAQLIDTVTGFNLWSQTYDRTLGDLLKLQADIAEAVASALKVKLLGDAVSEMKVGGTRNPAAYDAYLRSAGAYWQVVSASDNVSVRAGYQEAVRLDPNFALAYAEWSIALGAYASLFAQGPAVGDYIRQAQAPALKAVALAPELAEGHLALALARADSLDFAGASDEFQRAITLAPGNARVLRDYGAFAVEMGRTDAGIAAARRAAALDPLNENSHSFLSSALLSARRYDEAFAAYQDALSIRPKDPQWRALGHLIYYALGDFEKMRTLCEGVGEAVKDFQDCLALAYHKLGRQTDAEIALARFQALEGNTGAYSYATIYAQWGNTPKALEWLETALQLRDPQLINLKTAPLLDPLRLEPRFKAIERELNFPP